MEVILLQFALSILDVLGIEASKKIFKRTKRKLTKDLLNQSALKMSERPEYKGFETQELLRIVLFKEDLLFEQLNSLVKHLGLNTKVLTDGENITIKTSAKDREKVNYISDICTNSLDEEKITEIINMIKPYFKVITPIKPSSPTFLDWLNRKCRRKFLIYSIDNKGFYSISRSKVETEIPHDRRLYIVDVTDINNYTHYEVKENQQLSDTNNIVIKSTVVKGYIVAVSGTL